MASWRLRQVLRRKGLDKRHAELRRQWRSAGLLAVSVACVLLAAFAYFRSPSEAAQEKSVAAHDGAARALSGSITADCDVGAAGLIIIYLGIILYLFVGLAIVCDEFFVPALELISERLALSEDVAGATFMAAGSSAPELFTSLADALGPQNSVGVGTIVGSAMFNILVIVALAAAAAQGTLHIDWRPLIRDAVFYTISLALMSLFITGPESGKVEWYEGLIMILAYGVYIGWMVINPWAFAKCEPKREAIDPATLSRIETGVRELKTHEHVAATDHGRSSPSPSVAPAPAGMSMDISVSKKTFEGEEAKQGAGEDGHHKVMRRGSKTWRTEKRRSSVAAAEAAAAAAAAAAELGATPEAGEDDANAVTALKPNGAGGAAIVSPTHGGGTGEATTIAVAPGAASAEQPLTTPGDKAEDDDDDGPWYAWPKEGGIADKAWFIASFPWMLFFVISIPDCSKEHLKKYYLVSFSMSILWIGGVCVGMVELASVAGCMLEIDPPVMGIVVLAVGTSVPDAMASMIVAREGEADMAIANAVGSNVFDILLGLGVPWFLVTVGQDKTYPVDVGGIEVGLAILFSTVGVFVLTIVCNRFRMNSTLGWVFLAMYIFYISWTLLAEYCVLPHPNPAKCQD